MNLPWTYEFDDHGGYDCMDGAYMIVDSLGSNIFKVECSYPSCSGDHPVHSPCEWAEETVKLILAGVNKVVVQ